jgi:hypothetical protein
MIRKSPLCSHAGLRFLYRTRLVVAFLSAPAAYFLHGMRRSGERRSMEELTMHASCGQHARPRARARVPDLFRISLWLGRALLLGMLLVLAVSPWTECLWQWDRFPQGGSDMELGLLACVAMVSLAVLVAQQGKHLWTHRLSQRKHAAGPLNTPQLRSTARFFLRTNGIHFATPPIVPPLKI